MKPVKHLRGASAACLLAVPLVLSGCSLFGSESAAVDPPPAAVEAQMLQVSGEDTLDTGVFGPASLDETNLSAGVKDTGAPAVAGERTTVYLEDQNGLLAPVALSFPKSEDTAMLKNSLTALVSKGDYASALPKGFQGVLPAGTKVNSVSVGQDHVAIVEFNSAFNDYEPSDERKILEALTWTLTGQDDIKGVQLWVDGKKLNEMPLQGTPLDRPLSRTMGINLPKNNSLMMNSSAVTVYFAAASPDGGHQYYVPVTRFVPAGGDTVKAALSELIAGPQSENGLEMVMTQGTVVDSVKAGQNGVVTVSLTDDMFDGSTSIPEEMLESVVLTVAQNTDDSLVQIRLNGKDTVTGTNNVDYGQPVSAPEYVNELPL
ncbi:GerMN domain-containing protein [Paenibacillus sp. FSL H3-0469]|uniref:GerMN domain-containing protein n=1 Tax=Paenibacillus sp. FSL H3-0469 TaxID=2954506 RepID=UPI0031010D4E